MSRFIIGVDEAGRGPLAGPVAVGVVSVRRNFDIAKAFPHLRDSKLVTPLARERLYALLIKFSKEGKLTFCVRFARPKTIDTHGLTYAVRGAVYRGVRALAPSPKNVKVLLDGLLYAPKEYKQETIIGGDENEPIIALASIVAKVRHDRLMRRVAKLYPHYGFEVHKGYGTKKHYSAIKKYGLCDIHRRSFCGIDRG